MVILAFSGGSAVNGAADLPFIGTYIAVGIFVYVVLAVVGCKCENWNNSHSLL